METLPLELAVLGITLTSLCDVAVKSPAVILLHGWPYDIHSFVDVTPLLAATGRVIVPYLRGYGSTEFLSSATLRNGGPAALARDTVDLMDVLRIQRPIRTPGDPYLLVG
jgi:pimeloyl-ACP methyl ester carboxylesterase